MKPRHDRPRDPLADDLAFPKPRRSTRQDAPRTEGLALRKIHPERDQGYRRWLRIQPCILEGLTNQRTGVKHTCWSPATINGKYVSDPMHTGKSYSGRLKRADSGAVSGCRHAHRELEDNMDRGDADYGIDRHEIAGRMHQRYRKETGQDE